MWAHILPLQLYIYQNSSFKGWLVFLFGLDVFPPLAPYLFVFHSVT